MSLFRSGRSETLSFESEFNIICSTLSSNGALLLVINESKNQIISIGE